MVVVPQFRDVSQLSLLGLASLTNVRSGNVIYHLVDHTT